ncbi:ATP-binding cassette domain-containing protein [Streptomyces xanthophaeus]|uniref:Multidrug ABC transporter ATP-binding protein n=1 Tax=Streptomyces xanthophaeus TaxID=67385 RepID=A0A919LDL4_9ACTN|nr:ATP-binding cassette domain-containing protein [Streptomyces xanthophaeus]GHI83522.1 multidrug ABC transporter ATP-binding protein [Streptomyces xanthophaeus]
MITLRGLTKRYGARTAVNDLTLDVEPGRVTGFLGPNGAGKSTTMRMILGLDHPTAGAALVDGKPYASLRHPAREVGALLDAKALHPARSARSHLIAQARSNGIPVRRVDEVLEEVGLAAVARRRAGAFSLGMYQRLGVAGALLGDPKVLVLDEPVNGLDPDGVRWVRELVRAQAAQGRTVFLSSHLMSEMQLTADRLVAIGRGRLLADTPLAELLAASAVACVRVATPAAEDLRTLTAGLLAAGAVSVEPAGGAERDVVLVRGSTAAQVGDIAHRLGIRLHQLHSVSASLEQAYMELTGASVEYTTGPVPAHHHPEA